jgi:hypothetical protein
MTQYAQYNPNVAGPSPVTGWYDTELFGYPNLPPASDLLEVTAAQWAARLSNPPGWAVSNGALVAYTPPPPVPTLAQQAAALIAGGITITSTGTAALNGVYNVQSGVPFGQEDIATEAQFISTYGEFTNGATTNLQWPLLNGTFVAFPTTAAFLAFAKAAAQFIAAVKLAVGQGAALPAATATIP